MDLFCGSGGTVFAFACRDWPMSFWIWIALLLIWPFLGSVLSGVAGSFKRSKPPRTGVIDDACSERLLSVGKTIPAAI